MNMYILVNSVINQANYLQLQKHYIKYSTSHSYYVVTIIVLYQGCSVLLIKKPMVYFIYKNQINHGFFDQKHRTTLVCVDGEGRQGSRERCDVWLCGLSRKVCI